MNRDKRESETLRELLRSEIGAMIESLIARPSDAVEIGPRAAVFDSPQHPYTQSLLSAVPIADPRKRRFVDDLAFKPITSPIFPLGHQPAPSTYAEVAPGHFVLSA